MPWGLVFLGLALGVGAVVLWGLREPSKPLDRAALATARSLWSERAPRSYVLELETEGAMSGRHRIEVLDGEVAGMTTGGTAATPSAWTYWTVDGLFAMMEAELDNAASPRAAYGVDAGEVVLRARFDPEWGYPDFFLRHVMGSRQGVEWRVVRFEPQ